ncbi:HCO3- transporter family [Trifolium repens]|nr:HCO3- transporter family [Trifolium repens]
MEDVAAYLSLEVPFQTLLCGLIGLPPSNGDLPQSPIHTKRLTILKKQNHQILIMTKKVEFRTKLLLITKEEIKIDVKVLQ